MSDLRTTSAAQASTIYFDPKRNRFTSEIAQAQGQQRLGGTMGSTGAMSSGAISITFPRDTWKGMRKETGTQIAAYCNQVAASLFTAIQAMGSLKTRAFDSHNHEVQARLLKLVQMASGEGNDAAAALTILQCITQDPKLKPLLTRALASAMGGAPWIQKDASRHGLDNQEGLSAPAIQAFLKLSEREDILSHDDCIKIRQQLSNHQVFSNDKSPLWQGIQSLPIKEREQLGDCFGEHPRSVYEKSRELIDLRRKHLELDARASSSHLKQNPSLRILVDHFKYFNVNLRRNGFTIPENLSFGPPRNGPPEKAASAQAAIEEFLPVWQKFQVDPNDSSLTTKQLTLCRAVQEAHELSIDGEETVDSLDKRIGDLDKQLPQPRYLHSSLVEFPDKEAAFRRTLMAGKPSATAQDCWDIIISQDKRFQELGTYEEYGKNRSKESALLNALDQQYRALDNQKPFDVFLNSAANIVGEFKQFIDYAQYVRTFDSLEADIFRQLGNIPDDHRSNPGLPSRVDSMAQSILEKINNRLYQGQEPPKDMSPRRSIEQYFKDHPDMDPTQKAQIQEILRIAAKLKIEG
jgi:hypothetical protein